MFLVRKTPALAWFQIVIGVPSLLVLGVVTLPFGLLLIGAAVFGAYSNVGYLRRSASRKGAGPSPQPSPRATSGWVFVAWADGRRYRAWLSSVVASNGLVRFENGHSQWVPLGCVTPD